MKINLSSLPKNSGCYIYKDRKGRVIYVGKAKRLRERVSSYFNEKQKDPKTKALVKNIEEVEFIITKNEIEAILLENNLIKKHSPKYNIQLKDSKSYAYIEITKEKFPRVISSRDFSNKKEMFGPFAVASVRENLIEAINKIFLLRTCKRLPKKACLRYHLNYCSAPCIGKIEEKEYEESVNLARELLKGNAKIVLKKLEYRMEKASKEMNFESAIKYRNQMSAIKNLNEKQVTQRNKNYDENVIYYRVENKKIYIVLFKISKGVLEERREFIFEYYENVFEKFIKRYYYENKVPREIILQEKIEEVIPKYLSKIKGSKIEVIVPQRGEKKELLYLAKENLNALFFRESESLNELKRVLSLDKVPNRIECFDVSHLSGKNNVGVMVYFENGIPNKKEYRKFKISLDSNDDYFSIQEIVRRRYSRLKTENLSFPDLIVIDGGKGQLHYAKKAIEELGLKIPIISLAEKTEEIYIPNVENPIQLGNKNKARLLLERVRNEAHRFAINYNKQLRKKGLIKNGK